MRQRDYVWINSTTPRDRRRRIVAEVAEKHGLGPEDLMQPGRKARVAHARFEAMALLRREFGDSYSRIGRFFGGMNHSSVMHGVQQFQQSEAR